MTKQTISAVLFTAAIGLGLTIPVQAGPVQSVLVVNPTFSSSNQTAAPDTTDYEGIAYDGTETFPFPAFSIGTFTFTLPANSVVYGATISGTFGDVNTNVSALADLYVDGENIEVGECDIASDGMTYPPCADQGPDGPPVSWSYTFSSTDLGNLATDLGDGSIDFNAIQNSPFGAVIVGDPTLTIYLTPEPASIVTLAGGLLAFAALRRRK